MGLLRTRSTVGQLIVAVAVAGVILGVGAEVPRRLRISPAHREEMRISPAHREEMVKLGRISRAHSKKAALYESAERSALKFFEWNPHPANRFLLESAAYYAQLKRKYEAAAAHPWQTVPPDPLPPGGAQRRRAKRQVIDGLEIVFLRHHVDLASERAAGFRAGPPPELR